MKIYSKFFNPRSLKYFEEKHKDLSITLFWDYIPPDRSYLEENPYNIFLLHEPNDFFGIPSWVISNNHAFDLILTWDERVLSRCLNSMKFYCGWIFDWDHFTPTKKKFEVSFLSGIKEITEGHKLRQEIFSFEDQIRIPKNWNRTLPDFDHENNVRPGYTEYAKDTSHIPPTMNPEIYGKQPLFDSMFHIAIENTIYNNFYTEKIHQAFLNKTVPIYWGCPNLSEIGYDTRGVIQWTYPNRLVHIINNLTEEDYFSRMEYIEYNYKIAFLDLLKPKLNHFLEQIKTLNNL